MWFSSILIGGRNVAHSRRDMDEGKASATVEIQTALIFPRGNAWSVKYEINSLFSVSDLQYHDPLFQLGIGLLFNLLQS